MPHNIHVESFLEMLAVERGAAATTCDSYRRNLGSFAEFLGERGHEINNALVNDLRAFLAELTEAGLTRSTVAQHLSCLRQFYGFLFVEGLRKDDPTSTIDSPRRGQPLPKVLSESEVERLLDAAYAREGAAGIRLAAMVELLYATGLRVSELVGLPLSAVTEIPGQHYMVYDAGHWTGDQCLNAVRDIVDGDRIDLLIISHSDSDHLGEADNILAEYSVDHVIWTGFPRWDTANWRRANDAIAEQVKAGASVWNLQTVDLEVGKSIPLGDATVTLVAGWPEWTDSGPTASEKRNAISLVVRLDYQGRSVLFTGDTVGRRKSDPNTACKDAEKVMVDRQAQVPISADVLIAPHHGGNNGSANCFIQAVDPTFVIFPAGHAHDHPSSGAAQRYIDHGIPLANIFRTDRGDDEGGFEWDHGRVNGCSDGRGDDGVDIVLTASGAVQVDYRQASSGC